MSLTQSLRMRLIVGGGLWILLALLVAGLLITASFSASIEAERRDDLEASLNRLVAAMDPDAAALTVPDPLADPRYDTPLSGMYWQIDDLDTKEIIRSRSLWDQTLPVSIGTEGNKRGELVQITGPNGRSLIVLTQSVRIEGIRGERHFNVAVAESRDKDDGPVRRFGVELTVALVVLGVVLLAAATLQVYFGLRPLTVLRQQIGSIRRGEASRLPANHSRELAPLAQQVNELLEAQDASISFARDRAADLAHGLKTPLAVLSATSDRLRSAGDEANANLLLMLVEQMNSRIDYQLRVARLRFRTRAQGASSSLNEVVLRSVAVLRKGHLGERLNWIVDLREGLFADMDEHDLFELAGIVLENASQWAATCVQISGLKHETTLELVVEDDGGGISEEDLQRLGRRGVRLDEQSSGDGLGLAIALEIVRLNHGQMEINRSHLGGLKVSVRLPLAQSR